MRIFGAILLLVGIALILLAAALFWLYGAFENGSGDIGRVTASLKQVKHKKNVRQYVRGKTIIIKDLSKGTYEYTVDGKTYKIKYKEFATARQMPYIVTVLYLKTMPKIAHVKTNTSFNLFDIYAILCAGNSVILIILGLLLMF